LSPDDLANLGAYLIRVRKTETRLPDYQEAVVVLEAAYRAHPRHFAILANLGTVYQLNGMLDAAERLLEQAVGVAPPEWARFEAFQLRLVQARLHEPRRTGPIGLDLLFNRSRREPPVFLDPESPWRVGRLSERDRLLFPNGSPVEAMQIVQQLLLWLPDDGRLLWMYAEMLNAFAQPRPALQAMTLAVDLFRLSAPELRQRRQILREYLTWAGILDRVGTVADQRIWFARTAARASASAAVGLPLVAIDDWLPLTKAKALIDPAALLGKKSEGDPLPAEFDWSKLPWPPIVGGAAVVLMLIFLQMREWWRRLRRAQRPA
ncbi:MAG TPA: tetratricopeptide repeat protein, partial [Gemmatales bacterium]|nr:tetratricopeptide repeat protein [Gemmatales bacterium]